MRVVCEGLVLICFDHVLSVFMRRGQINRSVKLFFLFPASAILVHFILKTDSSFLQFTMQRLFEF